MNNTSITYKTLTATDYVLGKKFNKLVLIMFQRVI